MSQNLPVMDQVLKRLFTDRAFRDRLRRDPEAALAPFALSAAQRRRLSCLCKRPSPPSKAARHRPPISNPFSSN